MAKLEDIVYIIKRVKGQKAIHVGAVGQGAKLKRHLPLLAACPDIIGFDKNKELVKIVNKRGHNEIFVADATKPQDMKAIVKKYGTFPHVVIPAVIEHVPNLGLFLEGCKILLAPQGKMYFSAPYVWSCSKETHVNKDHICWFCEKTMKILLRKHGLKITDWKITEPLFVVIAEKP